MLVVIPVYNLPSEEQTYSMIRNLREIIPSVHVLIVNNSPSENSYRKLQEISDWYFVAGENMGIGFAYNLALLLAKLTNERWILILDQDSQIIDVRELKSLLEKIDSYLLNDNIAIISINKKFGYCNSMSFHPDFYDCKSVVNSGSLLNVNICWKLRYDEKLLIDRIDNEYCHRLRKNGYRILAYKKQLISHSVGNGALPFKKRLSKIMLLILKTLAITHGVTEYKKVLKSESKYILYPTWRYYLIIRNTLYLAIRGRIDFFFIKSLPTFVLALYEQSDLLTTLKLLLRAIYYSLLGNLDRDNRIFILKNKK